MKNNKVISILAVIIFMMLAIFPNNSFIKAVNAEGLNIEISVDTGGVINSEISIISFTEGQTWSDVKEIAATLVTADKGFVLDKWLINNVEADDSTPLISNAKYIATFVKQVESIEDSISEDLVNEPAIEGEPSAEIELLGVGDITITVATDSNGTLVDSTNNTIVVAKGTTWADIKVQAESMVKGLDDTYFVVNWSLNKPGDSPIIQDGQSFNISSTVYANFSKISQIDLYLNVPVSFSLSSKDGGTGINKAGTYLTNWDAIKTIGFNDPVFTYSEDDIIAITGNPRSVTVTIKGTPNTLGLSEIFGFLITDGAGNQAVYYYRFNVKESVIENPSVIPTNFVKVTFNGNINGKLNSVTDSTLVNQDTIVYAVHKDITWDKFIGNTPQIVANDGFEVKDPSWNTIADGSGTNLGNSTNKVVESNYYAQYIDGDIKITVNTDLNGLLVDSNNNTIVVKKGTTWAEIKAQAESMVKGLDDTYFVVNWTLNKAGDSPIIQDGQMFNISSTVYANFSKFNIITAYLNVPFSKILSSNDDGSGMDKNNTYITNWDSLKAIGFEDLIFTYSEDDLVAGNPRSVSIEINGIPTALGLSDIFGLVLTDGVGNTGTYYYRFNVLDSIIENPTVIPDDYVKITFSGNVNGTLDSFTDSTLMGQDIIVYAVHKDLTWNDLHLEVPIIVANSGYLVKDYPNDYNSVADGSGITIPEDTSKVYESTFYAQYVVVSSSTPPVLPPSTPQVTPSTKVETIVKWTCADEGKVWNEAKQACVTTYNYKVPKTGVNLNYFNYIFIILAGLGLLKLNSHRKSRH